MKSARQRSVVFVVVAMAIICAFAWQGAVYRQLDRWKLIPRPERLTELYFTDHQHLPVSYAPGQTQTVAFTIHNLEYRTTTYHYQIRQGGEADSQIEDGVKLAEGSLTLAHDALKELSVPVVLENDGSRSRVQVLVDYRGIKLGDDAPSAQEQSIHYWVALRPQAPATETTP